MKGNLVHVLPRRPKIAQPHLAAMPYQEVPGFVAILREQATVPVLALEFLILTAVRSGEVRGARWDEIDFDAEVWTIPAARMKGGSLHRVPLAPRAIEILHEIQAMDQHDALIFPGKPGRLMDPRNLRALLPTGATVHGFRSAFRDTGGAVERAYRRGDALERRRAIMGAWAAFDHRPKAVIC